MKTIFCFAVSLLVSGVAGADKASISKPHISQDEIAAIRSAVKDSEIERLKTENAGLRAQISSLLAEKDTSRAILDAAVKKAGVTPEQFAGMNFQTGEIITKEVKPQSDKPKK